MAAKKKKVTAKKKVAAKKLETYTPPRVGSPKHRTATPHARSFSREAGYVPPKGTALDKIRKREDIERDHPGASPSEVRQRLAAKFEPRKSKSRIAGRNEAMKPGRSPSSSKRSGRK